MMAGHFLCIVPAIEQAWAFVATLACTASLIAANPSCNLHSLLYALGFHLFASCS